MARLTAWEQIANPANRVVAVLADSTAALDMNAGVPTWPILLRDKMKDRWGRSGTGMIGTWVDNWTFTSGGDIWANSLVSDAWSKGPYDGGFIAECHTMLANGATKTATLTKPTYLTTAITSFKLYVVDGPSSANFSYRIDGGSWTDVSHTWNQDNSLDVITIASAVTSTVEVRGANAAGTAVNLYLVGGELITGTGATLHDLSASAQGLFSTARSENAADYNAWIDVIQPDLIVVCYTNDLASSFGVYNVTRITADLQSIVDRVAPYGKVIPMPLWGQDRESGDPGVTAARYIEHAGIYTSAAVASSSEYIDLYARYGDYATVNALGYMADALHLSDLGSIEVANVLWRLLARGTGNARVRTS